MANNVSEGEETAGSPRLPTLWLRGSLTTGHAVQIFRGIVRYRHEHTNWSFDQNQLEDLVANTALYRSIIGGIYLGWESDEAGAMEDLPFPIINVSNSVEHSPFAKVTTDDDAVGRLAAEHLLSRGFQRFLFCGTMRPFYARERERGFRKELQKAGVDHYQLTPVVPTQRSLRYDIESARAFTSVFQPPCAVLCADDYWAATVVHACTLSGLAVPQDVAVMGVNNDVLTCELIEVPITSVEIPSRQIGYEAAKLVDQWSRTGVRPLQSIKLPPVRVVSRPSTDITSVNDPAVAVALSLMQRKFTSSLSVDELARHAGVSRRVLETRFKRDLGVSPHSRLIALRVGQAKILLRGTNWSIGRIAEACGFGEQKNLNLRFRAAENMTPSQWRKKHLP